MTMPGLGPAEEARRRLLEVAYECLCQVASLREEDLPGIRETVLDNLLVNVSRPRHGRLGFFAPDSWDLDSHPVSEINFSTSTRRDSVLTPAESLFVTLSHEAAHAHAYYNGVKDTCNRGRYHNRRFGEIAIALGLTVVRVQDSRGHATTGIASRFRDEYAPLVARLERALVIGARVQRVGVTTSGGEGSPADGSEAVSADSPIEASSKYVFASCNCQLGKGRSRMIRVAAGSWVADAFLCSICNTPFATGQPESLTTSVQDLVIKGPDITYVGFVATGSHSARPNGGNV